MTEPNATTQIPQPQNQKPVDANQKIFERLTTLVGFDPATRQPSKSVVELALQEIQEERNENLKGEVKKLLTEAIQIRRDMDSLEKQFKSQSQKSAKTLTKLLSRIEAMTSGKTLPDEDEKESKEE